MPAVTRSRLRLGLFALYVVACLVMTCWPGYAGFGARVEPYILGLPFSLAWVVGWVVATFVALALFHASGPRGDGGGPR